MLFLFYNYKARMISWNFNFSFTTANTKTERRATIFKILTSNFSNEYDKLFIHRQRFAVLGLDVSRINLKKTGGDGGLSPLIGGRVRK